MEYLFDDSTLFDKQPIETTISEFKTWIKDKNDEYTDKCLNTFYLDKFSNKEFIDNIRNFPKCIVMMTRRLCNCNPQCLGNILLGFKFDSRCSVFNVQNIFLDDKYLNCDYLGKKVIDGSFIPVDRLIKFQIAKRNFQDLIFELCEDTSALNKIQCATYTLRDTCDNYEERCNYIDEVFMPNPCKNKDFLVDFEAVRYCYNYKKITDPIIKNITAVKETDTSNISEVGNITNFSESIREIIDSSETAFKYEDYPGNITNFSEPIKELINSSETALKYEDYPRNTKLRIIEVGCLSSTVIIIVLAFAILKLKKKGTIFKYALVLPIILFLYTFCQLINLNFFK